MAVLVPPASNGHAFADETGGALVPIGTYVADVMDIKDEFKVVRQKFDGSGIEKVDLTTFLFRFQDEAGTEYKMASKEMRISGHEKSSLYGFLKCLLGHVPQMGWDYLELKGYRCMLSVEHVQRRDGSGVFASISALSPLPAGLAGMLAPAAPAASVPPAAYIAPAAPAAMPQNPHTAATGQPAVYRGQAVAVNRLPAPARPMQSVAPVMPQLPPAQLAPPEDPLPF